MADEISNDIGQDAEERRKAELTRELLEIDRQYAAFIRQPQTRIGETGTRGSASPIDLGTPRSDVSAESQAERMPKPSRIVLRDEAAPSLEELQEKQLAAMRHATAAPRSLVGRLKDAATSGFIQGNQALEAMTFFAGNNPDDVARRVASMERAKPPLSAEMAAFQKSEGMGVFKELLNDIETLPALTLQGLGASWPSMVGGGAAAGAGALVSGPIGGTVGLVGGTAVGSMLVESGSKFLEEIAAAGVDLRDEQRVAAALRDSALVAEARNRALARGAVVATFDAATAGLAGRFLGPAKGVMARVKGIGKEFAMQAGGGMAGELGGQVVSGEDMRLSSIVAEGVAELPSAVVETLTGVSLGRGRALPAAAPAVPPAPPPPTAPTTKEPGMDETKMPPAFTPLEQRVDVGEVTAEEVQAIQQRLTLPSDAILTQPEVRGNPWRAQLLAQLPDKRRIITPAEATELEKEHPRSVKTDPYLLEVWQKLPAEKRKTAIPQVDATMGILGRDELKKWDWNTNYKNVMFIDIVQAKPYNELESHTMGDAARRVIGDALYDFAKRYGGDPYRRGGDEMVIIFDRDLVRRILIADYLSNVVHVLAETHISLSQKGAAGTTFPIMLRTALSNTVNAADKLLNIKKTDAELGVAVDKTAFAQDNFEKEVYNVGRSVRPGDVETPPREGETPSGAAGPGQGSSQPGTGPGAGGAPVAATAEVPPGTVRPGGAAAPEVGEVGPAATLSPETLARIERQRENLANWQEMAKSPRFQTDEKFRKEVQSSIKSITKDIERLQGGEGKEPPRPPESGEGGAPMPSPVVRPPKGGAGGAAAEVAPSAEAERRGPISRYIRYLAAQPLWFKAEGTTKLAPNVQLFKELRDGYKQAFANAVEGRKGRRIIGPPDEFTGKREVLGREESVTAARELERNMSYLEKAINGEELAKHEQNLLERYLDQAIHETEAFLIETAQAPTVEKLNHELAQLRADAQTERYRKDAAFRDDVNKKAEDVARRIAEAQGRPYRGGNPLQETAGTRRVVEQGPRALVLPDEHREALRTPPEQRTEEQKQLVDEIAAIDPTLATQAGQGGGKQPPKPPAPPGAPGEAAPKPSEEPPRPVLTADLEAAVEQFINGQFTPESLKDIDTLLSRTTQAQTPEQALEDFRKILSMWQEDVAKARKLGTTDAELARMARATNQSIKDLQDLKAVPAHQIRAYTDLYVGLGMKLHQTATRIRSGEQNLMPQFMALFELARRTFPNYAGMRAEHARGLRQFRANVEAATQYVDRIAEQIGMLSTKIEPERMAQLIAMAKTPAQLNGMIRDTQRTAMPALEIYINQLLGITTQSAAVIPSMGEFFLTAADLAVAAAHRMSGVTAEESRAFLRESFRTIGTWKAIVEALQVGGILREPWHVMTVLAKPESARTAEEAALAAKVPEAPRTALEALIRNEPVFLKTLTRMPGYESGVAPEMQAELETRAEQLREELRKMTTEQLSERYKTDAQYRATIDNAAAQIQKELEEVSPRGEHKPSLVAARFTPERFADLLHRVGIKKDSKTGNILRWIYTPFSYPVRALVTAQGMPVRSLMTFDEFLKIMTYRGMTAALAVREANRQGLTGNERREKIDEIQANSTKYESIHLEALRTAGEVTGTREIEGKWGKAFQQFIQNFPLARYWGTPFSRIAVNTTRQTARRLPFINRLVESVQEELESGDPAREAVTRARIEIGTGILTLGAVLTYAGILSGNGPDDPDMRKNWENKGWKPNAMNFGDRWIQIGRMGGTAKILTLAADIAEMGPALSEYDFNEIMSATLVAMNNVVLDKAFTQNLNQVFQLATGRADVMNSKALDNWLANIAVWQPLEELERQLDPALSEAVTILDRIKAKTPGWSKTLPPRRDPVYGRPVLVDQWGPDMMSPFAQAIDRHDPVYEAIAENDVKTDFLQTPEALAGSMPMGGRNDRMRLVGVRLTPEMRDRFTLLKTQKIYIEGKNLGEALADLIHMDVYKQAEPGPLGRGKLIRDMLGIYHTAATQQLFLEHGEFLLQTKINDLKAARALLGSEQLQQYLMPEDQTLLLQIK